MRTLVLALVLFPTLAAALDLRGVELGDPCDKAVRIEAELGSKPKGNIAAMRSAGIFGFEDASSSVSIPVKVLYNCSDHPGIVSNYSIAVTSQDEATALRALDKAKSEIIAKVGPPSSDSELLPSPQQEEFQRLGERVWIVRGLAWKAAPKENISILLTHRNGLWTVTTLVQAKHDASDALSR
jgi:hypothetical protein